MIEELGKVTTALVTDKNEDHLYVQKSGITYEVVEDHDADLGDPVTGFVYSNRQDQYKMTLTPPQVQVGQLGWGEVVKVRRQLGVFVDIGLPDKDMVVSLDDLPSQTHIWPEKGDRLYLSLEKDKQDRLWGKLGEEEDIIALSKRASQEAHNQDIKGVVYETKLAGSYVLTEEGYLAFIHPNEREREPRLGEVVEGRVIMVHPDGSVNLSLLPRAHEALEDDAALIYQVLKRSSGQKIPYTDKSDPEEIRHFFGISKGAFKRSVGRLMKKGLVKQDQDYTYLIKEIDD